MFGWRGRVGFISPRRGAIHTSAIEMQMAAPEGVLIHSSYLDGPKSLAMEHLQEVWPEIEPAAAELTRGTQMDVILLGGAPVCLANGPEKSIELLQQVTGRPATTVVTGLVNGLRQLDAEKIVVVTPYYPQQLADLAQGFFEESGFHVVSLVRGGDVEFGKHKETSQYDTYRLAKNAFLQAASADALVLVGGGTPIHSILDILETDIGRPVVTNNFASLWNVLNMMSVRQPMRGYGKLLTCF